MASFSYNPFSDKSLGDQYYGHIQKQSYTNQIDNSIRSSAKMLSAVTEIQSREIRNTIESSTLAQVSAINQANKAVCSSIESGFSQLDFQVENLTNLIGHGFAVLIEGQKITNKYLGQIEKLLHIPDSQKQRAFHIEEGIKFLKYAFSQPPESEYYTYALDEFKKAEAIDPKDFFSLYHIGFIYLKSIKHINVQLAEEYFKKSASFYLAEAYVSGTNVSKTLLEQQDYLLEAAEAYLYASEACYIQQKYAEAIELASKAWETYPALTKAGFMKAKYLAANNQVKEAVEVLEEAIHANRFLSIEVIPDLDLVTKPEVVNLLERLKDEAIQDAKASYVECCEEMMENSVLKPDVDKIGRLISHNNFLDAKRAKDMVTAEKTAILGQDHIEYTNNFLMVIKYEKALASVDLLHQGYKAEAEAKQAEEERVKVIERKEDVLRKMQAPILNEIVEIQTKLDKKNAKIKNMLMFYGISFSVLVLWLIVIPNDFARGLMSILLFAAIISSIIVLVRKRETAIYKKSLEEKSNQIRTLEMNIEEVRREQKR